MFRAILMTTAIAIAVPAVAQTSGTMGETTPAQGTAPAAPQDAMPSSPTMPEQTPASPQAATPAQPANPAGSVATIVDTEFPAYDANSDGQLDKAEFGKWMVALKDQEMRATGKTLPAQQVTAWADGAFTTADKDKSSSVSKPELVSYLSGGTA